MKTIESLFALGTFAAASLWAAGERYVAAVDTPEKRAALIQELWKHDPADETKLWPAGKVPLRANDKPITFTEKELAQRNLVVTDINDPFFTFYRASGEGAKPVVVILCIALIMLVVYFFMDKKLDEQTGEAEEKDDPFKISDLGQILTSSGFWLVSLLCVLYYSAIFPFQKYAVNMLQCNLTFTEVPADSFWASPSVTIVQYVIMLVVAATAFMFNFMNNKAAKHSMLVVSIVALVAYCYMGYMRQSAESIFAVFPLLAVGITPVLGNYVDHKGKATSRICWTRTPWSSTPVPNGTSSTA